MKRDARDSLRPPHRRPPAAGAWLGAALLAAAGCSSSGASDGEDLCAAAAREGYPEAPYGLGEGDVIDDLAFVTPTGTAFQLADLHHDADVRLILLSTAAFWCTACIEEQPTVQGWHDQYGPSGLAIVVAVFEDINAQPATDADAAQWVDQFSVDFTVVADEPFVLEPYYPNGDTTATPLNLVIDPCSMEILHSSVGGDSGALEGIIEARL